MRKYTYTSPIPCHINIKVAGLHNAVSLFEGEIYDLPEENKAVQRMEAQGLLKPVYKTPKMKTRNG